jgi:Xaa-Pro aminopeptidase
VTPRLSAIVDLLGKHRVDGLLLNHEPNVTYLAGFPAPEAYALVSKKGPRLITDFRYTADFRRQAKTPLKIHEIKGSVFKTIAQAIVHLDLKHVGFESRHLTFAECELLHKLLGKKISFIPLPTTLEPLRAIKNSDELNDIRKAIAITLKTYRFIEKRLKPGTTELSIVGEIERFIRLNGAEDTAFDTIVASGPNASYPHARASERKIKRGEAVVVDMGVAVNGYKCDLTRTFFVGKIDPIVRRAAKTVTEAQAKAIQAIHPGVPFKDIDAAARQFIAAQGFGKNFGHALGHGVGLEIHESPSVNKKNIDRAQEGMIFTVEPGIYVAGKFGIRMEDMVLVTKKGVVVLSGNDQHQSN